MYKLLIAFILIIPSRSWSQSVDRLEQVLHHSFSTVSAIDVEHASAQIALLQRKNGLKLQSSISHNDFAGLELGNVWRISAGLNFDILNGGFVQRNEELKSLELEKQIAELDYNHHVVDRNYGYLFNYLIYCFNAEKASLLEQKKFVLSSQINKNKNLYYNHELNYEEILYLKSLNDEADIILSSMDHMDKMFKDLVDVESIPGLSVRNLPILEINVDALLADDPFSFIHETANIKKKKVDQDIKKNDQKRLNVFYNLNYRPNVGNVERSGLYNNFGVRFISPLVNNRVEQGKLASVKKDRIDAVSQDYIFNENKELILIVLDYNSKLRQYSNFTYKLRRLQEQKRVGAAIQKVSTHQVDSRKDWKVELEILNVEYELLDLKQLLYLSLLRIYNKAKLTSLKPYVNVRTFDESQRRFRGNRVLKIADTQLDRINNDFVIKYLQKNNFKYALWLSSEEIPLDFQENLYKHGISISANPDSYQDETIIQVPVSQFANRSDMELWINDTMKESNAYLFFEKIEDLLFLDSKTLGE